jgi:UDP-glucose 4-epimerase
LVEVAQAIPQETDILALDNLSNSSIDVLEKVRLAINDCEKSDRIHFVQADITDEAMLMEVFRDRYARGSPIASVIHFAALKAVGESIEQPLRYYRENVGGLLSVLEAMQAWHCRTIIFSSSATVYGSFSNQSIPCKEDVVRHTVSNAQGIQGCAGLTNPYGRTKWMCEAILHDYSVANKNVRAIALRYFNPVGAHESGHLSETPLGPPSNLMPSITAAMQAELPVKVFGTDYSTLDGTAVRDYIHVVDLARGHVAALQCTQSASMPARPSAVKRQTSCNSLESVDSEPSSLCASSWQSSGLNSPASLQSPYSDDSGSGFMGYKAQVEKEAAENVLQVYNLGTGRGHTVREVIESMRRASRKTIRVVETERRVGDVEFSVADPSKANNDLAWNAQKTLDDACEDVWRSLTRQSQYIL